MPTTGLCTLVASQAKVETRHSNAMKVLLFDEDILKSEESSGEDLQDTEGNNKTLALPYNLP